MLPHLRRRDVARIDRRPSRRQHRQQGRLRPLQMKRDLVIAVGRHLRDIVEPGLARVDAQFLRSLALQQIDRAFDVGGGERLAVMPFDALVQRERQFRPVLVPAPAGGEFGDDLVRRVLRLVLLEHDEVVEHAHHRAVDRDGRFLEHRHAGRAGEMAEPERAAVLLRKRRRPRRRNASPASSGPNAKLSTNAALRLPPVRFSFESHGCWADRRTTRHRRRLLR